MKSFTNIITERSKKFSPTDMVYHGTSTKFLNSILSNGLIPNPKERVYSEPDKDKELDYGRSMASLEGVYLTDEYMTASGAATNAADSTGGQKLMVICDVSRASGFADEDIVEYIVNYGIKDTLEGFEILPKNHYPDSDLAVKVYAIIKTKPTLLDDIVRRFIGEMDKIFKGRHQNHDISVFKPTVPFSVGKEIFLSYIYRLISRAYNIQHYRVHLWKGLEYLRNNMYIDDTEVEEVMKTLNTPNIDGHIADKRYLRSLDYISKFYKEESIVSKSNVRFPYKVGFKGRNKIRCIYSIKRVRKYFDDEAENEIHDTKISVRYFIDIYYGEIPLKTMSEIIMNVSGELMIRNNGEDEYEPATNRKFN